VLALALEANLAQTQPQRQTDRRAYTLLAFSGGVRPGNTICAGRLRNLRGACPHQTRMHVSRDDRQQDKNPKRLFVLTSRAMLSCRAYGPEAIDRACFNSPRCAQSLVFADTNMAIHTHTAGDKLSLSMARSIESFIP
jgi:hypothetical protein